MYTYLTIRFYLGVFELSKMKKEEQKLELTLHSGIAHMTYKLDAVAVKTWFYLVSRVFNRLENLEQPEFSIPSKDLFEYLGTRDYEHIRIILESIRQTGIRFNILGKDPRKNWMSTSLLATVGIENGNVVFEIPMFLKQKLLAYKEMFVVINLMLLRDFGSKHALALYIVITDFLIKNIDQTEKIFTIEELRDLFGLKSDDYEEFKIFNRGVLKKAVAEINEKSSLNVTYKPYKMDRRKILSLKFTFRVKRIENQEQKALFTLNENIAEPQPIIQPTIQQAKQKMESKYILPKNKELLKFLEKYGIELHWTKHQIRLKELLDTLGYEGLEQFLEYCKKYTLQENNKGSLKMDTNGKPNISSFFIGLIHKQERIDSFFQELEKEGLKEEERQQKLEELFQNKLYDLFEGKQKINFKKYLLDNPLTVQDKLTNIFLKKGKENPFIQEKIVLRYKNEKFPIEMINNAWIFGLIMNYQKELKYSPLKFDNWYEVFIKAPENQEKIKELREESEIEFRNSER